MLRLVTTFYARPWVRECKSRAHSKFQIRWPKFVKNRFVTTGVVTVKGWSSNVCQKFSKDYSGYCGSDGTCETCVAQNFVCCFFSVSLSLSLSLSSLLERLKSVFFIIFITRGSKLVHLIRARRWVRLTTASSQQVIIMSCSLFF